LKTSEDQQISLVGAVVGASVNLWYWKAKSTSMFFSALRRSLCVPCQVSLTGI